MPLVSFAELMVGAERGRYAVGYFESWDLESLLAVADAAEAVRSPVLLGFSGIYLPHPGRVARAPLSVYWAMGRQVAQQLAVPCALVFNESPHWDWVVEAVELGFSLVMFSPENMDASRRVEATARLATMARARRIAVEAEMEEVPGVGGGLAAAPDRPHLTDPAAARDFVQQTGVDALAVNVGQVHLHGRSHVGLDIDRIAQLRAAAGVPLVLHGASSVRREDIARAVQAGIRKINVGSVLKQASFNAIRAACQATPPGANPYEVIGSGLSPDVLTAGRLAMRAVVEDLMKLFGSAGRT